MLVYLYIIRLWRDLSPGHGVSTCPTLGPRQRNGHGGVLLVLLLGRLHALQRLAQARHGPALAAVFAVACKILGKQKERRGRKNSYFW